MTFSDYWLLLIFQFGLVIMIREIFSVCSLMSKCPNAAPECSGEQPWLKHKLFTAQFDAILSPLSSTGLGPRLRPSVGGTTRLPDYLEKWKKTHHTLIPKRNAFSSQISFSVLKWSKKKTMQLYLCCFSRSHLQVWEDAAMCTWGTALESLHDTSSNFN